MRHFIKSKLILACLLSIISITSALAFPGGGFGGGSDGGGSGDPPPPINGFFVPATNGTGAYTVTWSGGIAFFKELQRSNNGGAYSSISILAAGVSSYAESGRANGSYIYRARTCMDPETGSSLCSSYVYSTAVSVVLIPGTPSSLTVPTTDTNGSFSLSWGGASGQVDNYKLYESKNGGSYSLVSTGVAPSKSLSGRTDATYTYRVRACNVSGCGGYRYGNQTLTVRITPSVPGTPIAPDNSGGANSVSVTWIKPAGTVTSYDIQKRLGSGSWTTAMSVNAPSTSAYLTSLADGSWTFRIRACNSIWSCSSFGASDLSLVRLKPGTPGLPNPTTTQDADTVTINWPATTRATYYNLERRNNLEGWSAKLAVVGATSKTISNLTDGSWDFHIQACNGYWWACSSYGGDGTQVTYRVKPSIPAAPTRPSTSTGSAAISWVKPSGTVSFYKVEKRKNPDTWNPSGNGNVSGITTTVPNLTDGSWDFRVQACNGFVWACSNFSLDSANTTVRLKPIVPTAVNPTTSQDTNAVIINWNAVSTATFYNIEKRNNGGNNWMPINDASANPIKFTVTSLVVLGSSNFSDGSWDFRARACNGFDWACSSYGVDGSQVAWRQIPSVPGAPNPTTTQDADNVTVNWSAVTGTTHYNLQKRKNATGSWTNVTQNALNYTGTSGVVNISEFVDGSWDFKLRACNDSWACSSYGVGGTAVAVRIKPATPSAPTLSSVDSYGNFTVNWIKPSGTVTRYELQERKNNTGTWTTITDDSALLSKARNDKSDGAYDYKLSACNEWACSGYSSISADANVLRIPGVPSSIAYDIENVINSENIDGSATVSWGTATGQIADYYLEEQKDGGAWTTFPSSVLAISKSLNSLSSGDYLYRVMACNVTGCSSYRTGVSTLEVRIKPVIPGAPMAPVESVGIANVAWASVTNATYYDVQKRIGINWVEGVYGSSNLNENLGGLTDGSWDFRVKACNEKSWSCSDYSTASGNTTVRLIPPVPTVINTPTLANINDITVSWASVTGATYYNIEKRVGGVDWIPVSGNFTTTSTALLNMPDGSWDFRISACNTIAIACSNFSVDSANVTVLNVPGVPSSVIVPASSSGSYAISWGASTGTVASYKLEEKVGVSGGFTEIYSGTSRNVDLTRSANGSYYYRVRACNGSGCSPYQTNTQAVVLNLMTPIEAPVTPIAVAEPVPTHDPSAGAIAGQFRVDESGQANYSIQIATVAGSGGVAPQIGLSYSSQGGNGLLGVGWNIAGQSAITRCRRTWEQDGINAAVDLSANDRFCLNGQRLILVSGSYGAANSHYKTEIDSQVEVIALGGIAGNPDSFTVEAKDGSISEYGNSVNSRQYSNALGFDTTVTVWAQNRFTDNNNLVNSNSYTYVYTTDTTTKEFLLDSINYSGATNNSITFSYIPRTDTSVGWSATGSRFESNQLLDHIESRAGTEIIRSYQLGYELNTDSLLKTITECVASSCLAPTTFTWQKLQKGFNAGAPTTTTAFTGYQAGSKAQPLDINGDGLQDIAYKANNAIYVGVSTGNNYSYQQAKALDTNYQEFWHQLDYNGDGRTDLLYLRRWVGVYHWTVALSNGSTFGTAAAEIDTGIIVLNADEAERLQVMDINADAMPDLVYQKSAYLGQFYVKFIQLYPDGTRGLSTEKNVYYSDAPASFGTLAGKPIRNLKIKDIQVVDFNGDGIVDIFGEAKYYEYQDFGPQLGYLWIPTDTRWTVLVGEHYIENDSTAIRYNPNYVMSSATDMPTEAKHFRILDVNGDGLADIMYRKTDENWYLLLNQGQGKFGGLNDINPTAPIFIGAISNDDFFQFGDYNHDGKADLIYINGTTNTLRVREWTGTGFATIANSILLDPPPRSRVNALRVFLDANGDGLTDYLNLEGTISELYLSKDTLKKNHVISQIDNGLGAVTNITYKPLTDSNVYTKGDDANMMNFGKGSPVFDIISPMYVVAEAESTSPGVTGTSQGSYSATATSRVLYRYMAARMQSGGRGFLGFEALATLDPQSNIETFSTYRQDFPFTGRPHATIKRLITASGWPELTGCNGECLPPSCNRWNMSNCNLLDSFTQTMMPVVVNGNVLDPDTLLQQQDSSSPGVAIELSRAVNTWKKYQTQGSTVGNYIYSPYLQNTVETSRVLDSNASVNTLTGYSTISETTTTNIYDSDANPEIITVVTNDGAGVEIQRKTTTNTYGTAAQTDYQRYGRLTLTTVNTQVAGVSKTRTSSFKYHPTTLMLSDEMIEPGNPNNQLKTLYNRDSHGNITKKTTCSSVVTSCGSNPAQNETNPDWINRWATTTYDASGTYPVTTTNALGPVTQTIVSRNNLGQVTNSMDIFGTHNIQQYDAFGYLIHSSNDIGAAQWSGRVLANDVYGTKVKQTVVTLGAPTTEQYSDALGRVVRTGVKDFNGNYLYKDTVTDTLGRVRFVSNPHSGFAQYWTESIFDSLGRIIETKQADGFSNTIAYNGLTQLSTIGIGDTQINGGNGVTKSETKNALGQLSNITDAKGGSIDYVYDLYGKLRFMYSRNIAQSKTITTEIQYDDLGRKIKTIDPDMGTWTYAYNALGELTRQTDAKSQVTENYYDALGRLIHRVDKNSLGIVVGNSIWSFSPTSGQLYQVENLNDSNFLEVYRYDSYGRLKEKETVVDNKPYIQYTWYDNAGRVSGTATSIGSGGVTPLQGPPVVANEYNSNGYLQLLRNSTDASIIWKATATDLFGNVTASESGDGRYISTRSFNPVTGLIEGHSVQGYAGTLLQQLSYQWDTLGNLRSRTDLHTSPNLTETFNYDVLNRLKDATIGADIKSYSYDDFGNLIQKDGNGYLYQETGNAGPHAVTKVGTDVYGYDANGNQINGDGRTLTYATFGKPTQIIKGNNTVEFDYAPSRGRYKKRSYLNGVLNETKVTAAGVEVIYKDNNTEVRTYIADALLKFSYTGSSIFGTKTTQYLFKDHLGSTDTVVTPNGTSDTVLKMSFGSFGERRTVNWDGQLAIADIQSLNYDAVTDKGYTGHEQLDDVGLIHMNGRVYDPKIGRFMSADPNIQAPTDTQSLNRYSYVLNNPLSATDPSGFFFKKLFKNWRTFAAIAISVYLPGSSFMTGLGLNAVQVGAITGFVAGAVATGTWKGALVGAFTGALFGNLHGVEPGVGKVLAHGFTGGISSVLNGGKFGHGFASAGMTQALGGSGLFKDNPSSWDRVKNAVKAAIVGGTMSAATGGKFQNGAVTGAFSRLLNDEASPYPNRGKPTTDFEEARDDQIQRVKETKRFHENPVDSRSEFRNSEAGGYIYFEDGKFVPSGTNIVSQGIIGNTELGNGAGAGNAGSYPQYPITKASIPIVASIQTVDVSSAAFSDYNRTKLDFIQKYIDSNIKLNYVITNDNVVFQLGGTRQQNNYSAKIISGKSVWFD